jgi:methyl-accepting chemotaxis protein
MVSLLIVAATGAGLWGLAQQRDIQSRLDRLERVKDDVHQMRFNAADVAGWQGLVVADAKVFGSAYAISPTGYNREGELDSKQTIYDSLSRAHTSDMTAAERARFAASRPARDAFFRADDQAVSGLATGTPQATARALKSVNGGTRPRPAARCSRSPTRLSPLWTPGSPVCAPMPAGWSAPASKCSCRPSSWRCCWRSR